MVRTACCFTFLVVFLLTLGLVVVAQRPFWFCSPTDKYTPNGTFDHNLRRALASLVTNVSDTFFSNVTVGSGADQVIATVQCRGDLDGEACLGCVSDSTTALIQRCVNNRFALFLVQECLLFYRDRPIPQIFMDVPRWTINEVMPDRQRFMPLLVSFFNKLILSATTNPSGHLFWGDKFNYTENITVYGTAQCFKSLGPRDCKSCLDMAFNEMVNRVAGAQGGAVFYRATCLVRYEKYPFFIPLSHQIDPSSLNFISSKCSLPASSDLVGTLFHRNLKVLLTYMIETGSNSGFYTNNVGLGSDQVYGQLLCRGDVSVDACWNCSAQASTKIQELCPNSRRAIVWFDFCQLRYSDVNFAGAVDVYDRACRPAVSNTTIPESFNQNLKILISNLTSLATQSSPSSFFATGKTMLPDSKWVYALVQCVGDIPVDQCRWCLQNASSDIERCSHGKQGGRIYRGSCRLAFGLEPFFFGNATLVSLPQPNPGHRLWLVFVIISIICGLILVAACALCLLWRRRRSSKKMESKETSPVGAVDIQEDEADYDFPQIDLKIIQDATSNFSEENKIGEGGFGPVYKGKLLNGQEVAVKRMSANSGQGVREFRNEAMLIAKLQHSNLVRLIGCCLGKGERLLVYEYMPNKSLDYFLKDSEHNALLDWERRFNIIMGIARGILYLHQDSRLNVVHRDLKAANVLLDEQMNPKISDFGMARIFTGLHGQATTSTIVGTYGYMAPEYALDGVFSTKSDVYSFGVLLLEIISGQLNSKFQLSHADQNLILHAWRLWGGGNASEFIDPMLRNRGSIHEMERCMQIGLLCIQEDAASRPTMSTTVLMLGSESLDLPLPRQPTYSHIITDAE